MVRWVAAGFAVLGGVAASVVVPAAVVAEAAPRVAGLVAYVRNGDVHVGTGTTERRLTSGGGHARPRWSPDGSRLAYLRAGHLWTMKADGSGKRRLTTRPAAGASWSPDGRWVAFASLGCTGGPAVYRIASTGGTPEVLFPAECRGEPLPAEPAVTTATGSLTDRLSRDDAVAWSPDGTRIAFRGGQCESIYDACLSLGTIATGGERTLSAFGGGGRQTSGFAVVPVWRPDGARLAWTAYQRGETAADDRPVHVLEFDLANGSRRTVGSSSDREAAYVDGNRMLVTGRHRGGSWVVLVDLASGARTPLHPGSQPSVQPVR